MSVITMIVDFMATVYISGYIAVLYWAMICSILLPMFMYWSPLFAITFLLYSCWIYYDRNTPRMGGRKLKWFCNLSVHNLLRSYFSNRLIKTADLPEGRNYILAQYPHGLYPFSVISNFINSGNKVADLFPGIEMLYLTPDIGFFIPIIRELALLSGACSCDEASFTYLLKSPPSKGVVVLPGGVTEMKYTSPDGIYKIIKRKGFVRLALTTGTPLVPVFTFGEVNAWTKINIIPVWQPLGKLLKDMFKCTIAVYIAFGRGILPKRVPVNTIVGAPISVPKVENPSTELIDEYYEIFFQALQNLFEQHKYEYDEAGGQAKLLMLSGSQ